MVKKNTKIFHAVFEINFKGVNKTLFLARIERTRDVFRGCQEGFFSAIGGVYRVDTQSRASSCFRSLRG
jgi:hypothetical protein